MNSETFLAICWKFCWKFNWVSAYSSADNNSRGITERLWNLDEFCVRKLFWKTLNSEWHQLLEFWIQDLQSFGRSFGHHLSKKCPKMS